MKILNENMNNNESLKKSNKLILNEDLFEESKANIVNVQDLYAYAVKQGLKDQAEKILSDHHIKVDKNGKCQEISANASSNAAYMALRNLIDNLNESLKENVEEIWQVIDLYSGEVVDEYPTEQLAISEKIHLQEMKDDGEFLPWDGPFGVIKSHKHMDESLKEDVYFVSTETSNETPVTSEANGIAKLILDAINNETDIIKMYNDLLANTDDEDIIQIIQNIAAEENNHVGMLQKALEIVSPNASNIEDGADEAEDMINESVLPVNDLGTLNPQEVNKIENQITELQDKEDKGIITPEEKEELKKLQDKIDKHYTIKKQLMKNDITENLNEDLHDKFKKDIKQKYKEWELANEKNEQQRKDALDFIPEDATEEQIAKFKKWVDETYPQIEFEYEFPHNIEKNDYPFYVTYYAEYPIYEPAEGGYYYPGRDAVWSEGFETEEEAKEFAKDYVLNDDDKWETYYDGYIIESDYVGENQYLTIEPKKAYLGAIAGWEPYQ